MGMSRRGRLALAAVGLVVSAAAGVAWYELSSPGLGAYRELIPESDTGAIVGGVRATFLGAATILLDDGETRIMTDGFFTRPGPLGLLLKPLGPDGSRIDAALSRAGVGELAAVFVAHSHLDHALDSAVVAARTGAQLYGSASTRNIALGEQLDPDRITVFADGQRHAIGRFLVTVIATPHAPDPDYPGTIEAPLAMPAPASAFREGGSFSFHFDNDGAAILVVASANYRPGALAGLSADIVFLSIAGLARQSEAFAEAYWRETVGIVGARRVVPIHWDNFTTELSEDLRPLPRLFDDFGAAMERIIALAARDGVEVLLPQGFTAIDVASEVTVAGAR